MADSDSDDDFDFGAPGDQFGKKPKAKAFDKSVRTDEHVVDDFDSTKLGQKKKRATKRGGGGRGAIFGISFSTAVDGSGDDDSSADDDDDDRPKGSLFGESVSSAGASTAAYGPARISADLRKGGDLPPGLSLVAASSSGAGGAGAAGAAGGSRLVEDEDGSHSLPLRASEHLLVRMGREHGLTSWELEADGRLHEYSLLFALKLDKLPSAHQTPLRLFSGGAAMSADEAKETPHLVVHRNGGVGALGEVGVAEAAVKPGRWAWIAVTRSRDQEIRTFVDGRLCAHIKRESRTRDSRRGGLVSRTLTRALARPPSLLRSLSLEHLPLSRAARSEG